MTYKDYKKLKKFYTKINNPTLIELLDNSKCINIHRNV